MCIEQEAGHKHGRIQTGMPSKLSKKAQRTQRKKGLVSRLVSVTVSQLERLDKRMCPRRGVSQLDFASNMQNLSPRIALCL